GAWLAQAGARASVFPTFGPALVGASASHGRAVVWKGEEAAGRVWLLVPVDGPEGTLVAAAAFATVAVASNGSSLRWGPPCPEPALRAWGQAVADQLRAPAGGPQETPPECPAPATAGATPALLDAAPGGDRQLIARLIRRLRISDPPGRFQQVAAQ